MLGLAASQALAERLTFERLHQDPPLQGPTVKGAHVAPDGSRVTYQKPREGDSDVLDLWQFEPDLGKHSELLRAEALTGGQQVLSVEEKARLERERIRQSGITHYSFSDTGEALLVPLGGSLYIYRFEDGSVIELSGGNARLDPKLSPDGKSVAFVQDRNLFLHDLNTGQNVQLTFDGSDTIVNGLADFIAQEEMIRPYGYWWSPNGAQIAFIQYDESSVQVIERVAIGGDGATLTKQRYPLAGTNNVKVRVGIVTIATKDVTWIDIGEDVDIYIPRVDWDSTGEKLFVQRQPREQDRLDLLAIDPGTGEARTLLTESSPTWVNLHDDLAPLSDGRFLWTSERSGFNHIYIYDADGGGNKQITAGEWMVDKVECVDEAGATVLFTGWVSDPRTRQLYRARLDGKNPSQPVLVTALEGLHWISSAKDCSLFLDTFSSPEQPPQTSLHDRSGKRLAWLEQNLLAHKHPYAPYMNSHSPAEFGTLQAEDGTELHWKMIRPHDAKPDVSYPAIIMVYGGPGVQTVWRGWGSLRDQIWADRGYVVFRLDNRGASRRGHAFEAHLHRRLGNVEVTDQLAGLEFLKKQPFVQADRIGVFGWSYGGFMSAMMLAKAGDQIAAGFVGAPVTDWALYDTHYTERYLDHPQDNPEGYRLSSVLPFIEGIASPLLLVHGMADDNVVFTNSTKFMQELQHSNIPFELMTYPGETHFVRNRTARLHLDLTVMRFFDRHLLRETR
jgi:dipeptidyl-peptidase-4